MRGAARRPAHMGINGGERLTDMGYLVSFKYPDDERVEVKRVD